ncbi:MAG: MGMT family protein [Candidatus Micrarchaeota archaeon]
MGNKINVSRLRRLAGWNELTDFERAVLSTVYSIPRGQVRTYSQVAKMAAARSRRASYARAARAVGAVMRKNPYAPLVPCHRVIRSDGSLGEYSGKGGRAGKMRMLKKEGVEIRQDARSVTYITRRAEPKTG